MFLAAHAARRRRRRFFLTGGAPPPPTEIDRRVAADTMTSAHSSTLKDQDKDKDLKYVPKESLRTRTRINIPATIVINIINCTPTNN